MNKDEFSKDELVKALTQQIEQQSSDMANIQITNQLFLNKLTNYSIIINKLKANHPDIYESLAGGDDKDGHKLQANPKSKS
ncbi:hypothetical protein FHQ08_03505 [Lactobacillus sp. CC-MHH1034]|uniref:hypothetical protein n=1 Tax=Agrilactobacillus fermenti TaxID=2586909 RepID=UPI001E41BDEF|nr:hypothetical protein [Agrilactobacillus fermenti]MCD2255782.1 hypothetical protein [Agrilactobacillus fermenti]